MNLRRALTVLISAAATAAALWAYGSHSRRAARAAAEPVPLQDGKTIDFSSGSPAVTNTAADKAAMDAAVRQIDEATKDVSFKADPPKKK